MDVVCPQDSHREEVHIISSIVREGTVADHTGVVRQTELARQLSMPPPPEEPLQHRVGCFGYFQILLWGILSVYLIERLVDSGSWGALIASVILLALAVFAEILIFSRRRSKEKSESEEYAKKKQAWDDANAKWELLYYCHRHGIVFDPANLKEFCDPSSLERFICQPPIFHTDEK